MHRAASGLRGVGHHTAKPLAEFSAQQHDLKALGALLGAKGEIEKGMATLSGLAKQLEQEWESEAKFIGEVSDAFDLLDVLLAAAQGKKG
ncbi:hypothetical protein [Streptomyces roseochromogenus]|nr:hypothetical protein [Streptomyces roseochromogenus]